MRWETVKNEGQAFLRWAGGKRWLVRRSTELFGRFTFRRYHEPFVGGGSFFFSLPLGTAASLSDKNASLIEMYQAVKEDCSGVIEVMRGLSNTAEEYYRVRSSRSSCRLARAAHFIYLNQTSYNGIYRVNLNGIYNVPYGKRSKHFLEENIIRSAAERLKSAELKSSDFMETLPDIQRDDLVFIDPPYTVSHNKNGFIKYNESLFSIEDQRRLADYIRQLRSKGARYILTNAAHDTIRDIFQNGDSCLEVDRASLIGGKKAHRGAVSEYVLTNLVEGV